MKNLRSIGSSFLSAFAVWLGAVTYYESNMPHFEKLDPAVQKVLVSQEVSIKEKMRQAIAATETGKFADAEAHFMQVSEIIDAHRGLLPNEESLQVTVHEGILFFRQLRALDQMCTNDEAIFAVRLKERDAVTIKHKLQGLHGPANLFSILIVRRPSQTFTQQHDLNKVAAKTVKTYLNQYAQMLTELKGQVQIIEKSDTNFSSVLVELDKATLQIRALLELQDHAD